MTLPVAPGSVPRAWFWAHPPDSASYLERLHALEAFKEWRAAALEE